jgi:hypothetical protein
VAWTRDAEVTEVTSSSCRVVLGSWSWAGLLAAVLAWDAPFAVVGPESLRTAVADLGSRMSSAAR